MKKNVLAAAAAIAVLVSCKNAQKQDEQIAKEKMEQADTSADLSDEQQAASDANAVKATIEMVQARIDESMSKVEMPKFTKINAKLMAESFHRDLSGLVNANSGKQAVDYADKLTALQGTFNKKAAAEKLDANDKKLLDKYVTDLITAVQTTKI